MNQAPTVYLPDRNINNILVDVEGNYWFTSPTEGVFLLTAHGVKTYYERGKEEAEIYSVAGNDEYIICGKDNGLIFINRKTGKKISWRYDVVPKSSVYNRIKDILISEPGTCWVASDLGAACVKFSDTKAERIIPPLHQTWKGQEYIAAMKCLSPGSDGKSPGAARYSL